MAVAAYASDLTDITNYVPPATPGDPFGGTWGAGGGGGSGIDDAETDFYIIDAGCVSKSAWASDDKWLYGPTQATTLTAGDAFFIWATHLVPAELNTLALGGLYVTIGNSSTANYEFYIGGADSLIYDDRWICDAIDPSESAIRDATNGSPSGTWSVFGCGADLPAGGPTKGAPLGFGGARHGRAFTVTDGQAAAYGTFSGAAAYNDDGARRFGQFQVSGGGYKMQGLFEFGTSGTAVDFRDANQAVAIRDTTHVPVGFNGFEVNNSSSKVLLESISFTALGTQSPGYWLNNADADVDLLSCTFIGVGDFDFLAATVATGCLWQNCGQITPAGADLSNSTVEAYEGAVDSAALVYNETADPDSDLEGMTFTKGTAATHAIEFGTSAPTTMSLTDVTFTDYSGTGTSAALNFLRTSGTTTLTISGSGTDPTGNIQVTGSHTVDVVTGTVTVKVTAKDAEDLALISGSRILLLADTGGDLPADDAVTLAESGGTVTVTHTAHGLATGDKVLIQDATVEAWDGVQTITVNTANEYEYTF